MAKELLSDSHCLQKQNELSVQAQEGVLHMNRIKSKQIHNIAGYVCPVIDAVWPHAGCLGLAASHRPNIGPSFNPNGSPPSYGS